MEICDVHIDIPLVILYENMLHTTDASTYSYYEQSPEITKYELMSGSILCWKWPNEPVMNLLYIHYTTRGVSDIIYLAMNINVFETFYSLIWNHVLFPTQILKQAVQEA